jgi:hypothetical protein
MGYEDGCERCVHWVGNKDAKEATKGMSNTAGEKLKRLQWRMRHLGQTALLHDEKVTVHDWNWLADALEEYQEPLVTVRAGECGAEARLERPPITVRPGDTLRLEVATSGPELFEIRCEQRRVYKGDAEMRPDDLGRSPGQGNADDGGLRLYRRCNGRCGNVHVRYHIEEVIGE